MGKEYSAFQYIATTGTGIVIGTGIDIAGIWRASDLAGTVTIKDSATTLITMSADREISFHPPVALAGPVTMTSSAGAAFVVSFRKRVV